MSNYITNRNIFKLIPITIFALFFHLNPVQAKDIQKDSVTVSGNCSMCQNRIVSAAAGKGVRSAQWDKNTKYLSVTYDADKTSMDEIEKRVAKAGHDTKNHKSDDATYEQLHSCCMYPRME